ncbi:MAG: hypothetical protein HYX54_09085 [Chloroflexi bacterium]|nr:hypothetical protein [Chloroflexota bacterium]
MSRRFGPVLVILMLAALLPAQVLAASAPRFTSEPGGGAAGAVWGQQPQVAIKTGNNVVESATGTISLAITSGTGTPGAVLTCAATTVSLVNGIAVFAGCRIDAAGTGYRLSATWSQGGSDESASFDIGGGSGSKLGFVVQPARGTPGVALAVQPSVAIQDPGGTTVVAAPATAVTLALGTNPGGATLTCTGGLSKSTVNGVAAFSGCRLDRVGVGFTVTATATALASATSALFDVADRLAFTTQPSGAAGGIAFTTQPVVAVRAGASSTATHDSVTSVTLSLKVGTGASGAILTCTGGLSKVVTNGVATFAGCAVDKASPTSPANPYVLVASASGLTAAESALLVVTAGPAAKLIFTAQPGASTAAQPLPTQPVVAITDAGGNIVTTGASSTLTVTLALGANPGGGILTCTGGLSKVATAGIATFIGCAISKPGVGYTIAATAPGLTTATSAPFTATSGTVITVASSASVITWGAGVTLTVRFPAIGGALKQFQLQGTRDGVTWSTIATLNTDPLGVASLTYRPATNLYYRAVFAGTPDLPASTSAPARVVVRQIALLRPTNSGAIKSIARNTSITFTTTVRPSRLELPPATVSFRFYRLSGGTWTLVTTRNIVIDSLGQAVTTFKFTSGGSWYVRSIANPTSYNANSVWSPVERYNVR